MITVILMLAINHKVLRPDWLIPMHYNAKPLLMRRFSTVPSHTLFL